jgi:hypothetical protein
MIIAVVAYDAVVHDPMVGYDAPNHVRYAEALAAGHWPKPPEVYEYFSPPLPYVIPAAAMRLCGASSWWAVKCAQLLNVVLCLVIIRGVRRLAEAMRPGDVWMDVATLLFLATVPAFYRTLALFRGEGFVAAFGVLAACELVHVVKRDRDHSPLLLGCYLGLAALSRQWAFGLWGGAALFFALQAIGRRAEWSSALRSAAIVLALAISLAAPFYLYLALTYGKVTAFNRQGAESLTLANQPETFYFGVDTGALRFDPIRPSAPNRMPTIFYADFWGDYWAYFLVYARDPRDGRYLFGPDFEHATTSPSDVVTNRPSIARYLGRNLVLDVFPSAFFVVGLLAGILELPRVLRTTADRRGEVRFLAAAMLAGSLSLFLWFVIMYPERREGDTVKASYMLQCIPFLALLAADRLVALRDCSQRAFAIAFAALIVIMLHNLPAAVTRYAIR